MDGEGRQKSAVPTVNVHYQAASNHLANSLVPQAPPFIMGVTSSHQGMSLLVRHLMHPSSHLVGSHIGSAGDLLEGLRNTQWQLAPGDETSSSGPDSSSSTATSDPSPEQEDLDLGSMVTLDLTAGALHSSTSSEATCTSNDAICTLLSL